MVPTQPETLCALREKRTLTTQEVFNIGWRWAITQNHPKCTVNGDGSCEYRNVDNTNACLIGACVPTQMIRENMKGESIAGLIGAGMLLRLFSPADKAFLQSFQTSHDTAGISRAKDYRKDVERELRELAKEYGLTIPE